MNILVRTKRTISVVREAKGIHRNCTFRSKVNQLDLLSTQIIK